MADPRDDSYFSAITGLGGQKDALSTYTWHPPPHLTWTEAERLYDYNDIAARICELPAEEALAAPWSYRAPDAPDLADNLVKRLTKLDAQRIIRDAQVFARVHGDCFVYVATDDGARDESRPLDITKIKEVKFLRMIQRPYLAPSGQHYADPREPNFALPMGYYFTQPNMATPSGPQTIIHETRFLKFYGARTSEQQLRQNNWWHNSVLQKVQAILLAYGVAWQNVSGLLAQSVQAIYAIKDLMGVLSAPEGKEKLSARIELIDYARSSLKSIFHDADGESFRYEVAPLTSVPEMMDRFAARLAASTGGIPVTKLLGISPAGMNATGEYDQKNWHATLASFRNDHYLPEVTRLTEMLCVELGQPEAEWSVDWPSLDTPTAKEEADLRQQVATTDAVYMDHQVVTPEEVRTSRFGGSEGWNAETRLDASVEAKSDFEPEPLPEVEPTTAVGQDEPDEPDPFDPAPRPTMPSDREDGFTESDHPRATDGRFGDKPGVKAARAAGKAHRAAPTEETAQAYRRARERVRRHREIAQPEPDRFRGNRAAGTAEERKAALERAKESGEDVRAARRRIGSSTKASPAAEHEKAFAEHSSTAEALRKDYESLRWGSAEEVRAMTPEQLGAYVAKEKAASDAWMHAVVERDNALHDLIKAHGQAGTPDKAAEFLVKHALSDVDLTAAHYMMAESFGETKPSAKRVVAAAKREVKSELDAVDFADVKTGVADAYRAAGKSRQEASAIAKEYVATAKERFLSEQTAKVAASYKHEVDAEE